MGTPLEKRRDDVSATRAWGEKSECGLDERVSEGGSQRTGPNNREQGCAIKEESKQKQKSEGGAGWGAQKG